MGCGFDEFVAAVLAKNRADSSSKAGFPIPWSMRSVLHPGTSEKLSECHERAPRGGTNLWKLRAFVSPILKWSDDENGIAAIVRLRVHRLQATGLSRLRRWLLEQLFDFASALLGVAPACVKSISSDQRSSRTPRDSAPVATRDDV
jgi:hypothetical protein